MNVLRLMTVGIAAVLFFGAVPAQAQFFFKSADVSGPRVTGAEPGMVSAELPGATPEELSAALVWNLRAAMNLAALQCDFEPTLRLVSNYNALLKNHDPELDRTHATLHNYFNRTLGKGRPGQTALDQYFSRVWSGFSVVAAQYPFCETAGRVGYATLFAPAGGLNDVAHNHMRELRNSLVPWGEQQFLFRYPAPMPVLREFGNERCWRRNVWQERRCGKFYAG
ncbi:hypothetical protein [Sphingomonas sp. AX6]|uniref:hypothetical protein n=1 Tax=Sphingomonas sp. AX6 TaxID=2653171 RepID=UPI0012F3527C|nr:hypothetical protein [Sphingomonas sp. AX6]VXC73843.1 conserved exported hypothetical protein [Sphingomonas sp. AX6]